MMRTMSPHATAPGPVRRPAFFVGGAAVAAWLVLLAPAAAAGAYGPSGPIAWTNGTVLCQFVATSPQVAVSAVAVNESGLSVSMLEVSEMDPAGTAVASASSSAASWAVANLSTDDQYDLEYSASAPVETGPSSAPTFVGSVDLSIQFILPAYEDSGAGPLTTVNVVFGVSDWPWQSGSDHLEIVLGAAPSFSATERMGLVTGGGWLLASNATSSGQERERLGMNSTATASAAGGSVTSVPATGTVNLSSPQWATVAIDFGTTAGAFTELSFGARVGVVLPATIAGIPLPELLATIAAAALVTALVAVSTRRLRRRPSSIIFVDEEP